MTWNATISVDVRLLQQIVADSAYMYVYNLLGSSTDCLQRRNPSTFSFTKHQVVAVHERDYLQREIVGLEEECASIANGLSST